jgi:hypothetical protein
MYAIMLGLKYLTSLFPFCAPIANAKAYITTSLQTALHPCQMWPFALNKRQRLRVCQNEVRRAILELKNQKKRIIVTITE